MITVTVYYEGNFSDSKNNEILQIARCDPNGSGYGFGKREYFFDFDSLSEAEEFAKKFTLTKYQYLIQR